MKGYETSWFDWNDANPFGLRKGNENGRMGKESDGNENRGNEGYNENSVLVEKNGDWE